MVNRNSDAYKYAYTWLYEELDEYGQRWNPRGYDYVVYLRYLIRQIQRWLEEVW